MSLVAQPHVSITKQREAYAKAGGICIICGKKLSADESKWSVDHFIPRAIYKWVPKGGMKELIESGQNIFVVHPQCNFSKDSTLPTNQNINSMHMNSAVKEEIKELYHAAENNVNEYRAIKQSTLDMQDRKCAICGKKLGLNDATLRRIDNHKGRRRENAMCLCDNCNRLAGNPHYKRKAVKKNNIKSTK